MPKGEAFVLQYSDLNDFLFADVGTEANGMTVTVLSVLARVGKDPWREAGHLASLPRMTAVDGLARIIAGMPTSRWSLADATSIATRLIALLPVRSAHATAVRSALLPDGTKFGASLRARLPSGASTTRTGGAPPAKSKFLWLVAIAILGGLLLNMWSTHTRHPDGMNAPTAPFTVGVPTTD